MSYIYIAVKIRKIKCLNYSLYVLNERLQMSGLGKQQRCLVSQSLASRSRVLAVFPCHQSLQLSGQRGVGEEAGLFLEC